ncbi:nickel-responsive transcriptional regulator NikR [Sphingomonas bacterium]|uniref:nickel-responsive transcriptional regulator NikR n=1 Tax=Sphingomonas bacterium TaxID=1895847 RepID=UPI001576B29B|nr:nickel-responsive transcriptional regulator NikR [Sphingomonas bacterium]
MQRVTISLDDDLATSFDAIVAARSYASRSEAVRDLVRQLVDSERLGAGRGGMCVASLSYVYDHRTRALAQRLLDLQHDHHELVAATTHVILDHESSLETVMLRGPAAAVEAFADQVIAERGVRFGAVNLIGVEANDKHAEPAPHHHHGHAHVSPYPG